MKKILTLAALMASVSAVAAVNDLVLTFSTVGPDTYADGSRVLDGERYALVWLPKGSTGFALAADGTVADPKQGEVVLTVPAAKDGKCPAVVFELDAALAETHTTGTWGLFLLDTRTTAADGNGTVTTTLAGATNGRVQAVNAVEPVKGASVQVQAKETIATATASGATVAATATALPKDVPQPKIKGIRVEGGYVYVTVESTVPYLRYNLAAGTDPANLDEAKAAKNPVNGKAGDEIILVTPAKAGSAFFRVNRD